MISVKTAKLWPSHGKLVGFFLPWSVGESCFVQVFLSEADSTHCVHVFLKNHIFNYSISRRQKTYSPTFMSSFSAVSAWAFLVVFPIHRASVFKAHHIDSSSYSFTVVARQTTVGRWIVVNHNTLRLWKHSPNFSRCHFCIYQSAIEDEIKRGKLVYVYMGYYHLRSRYTMLVCSGGDFFQSCLNGEAQVQFFFSILCSYKSGIVYTCLV